MFVSYDLRDSGGFPACRGADYIRLGAGLHAAVDPGQGLISACRGRGLDLRFYGLSAAASWLELGLQLGGEGQGRVDQAWRDSRSFQCRLRLALQPSPDAVTDAEIGAETDAGAAPQADTGQADTGRAQLALRLHHEQGFEDIFAPAPLPMTPEFTLVRAEINPPTWALSQARAVDLHLFLPPRNGALQISDFAVTGLR